MSSSRPALAPEAEVVSEARRIRSHYLLSDEKSLPNFL
jgi:hypothetical protein